MSDHSDMSDSAKDKSNPQPNVEEEIRNESPEEVVIEREREKTKYDMWLEESDPDDVDYEEEDKSNDESEKSYDEEDKSKGEETETDGEEEERIQENVKQRKGKEKKSDAEEEEDMFERFEFEVEEEVSNFMDELSMGRKQIPPDSEGELVQVHYRDRRIRRRQIEKLVVGNSFMNGVEFKEAVLDYALSSGKNVKQQKWDNKNKKLCFTCGVGGKCKWRIYCSYDVPSQLWLVKTTYLHHSCTPNGKCKLLKAPVIARLFLDKLRMNPGYMPKDIQLHIKEQWKFVCSRGKCQNGRLKALKMLQEEYATQFSHIRGYVQEIIKMNPGSTAIVDTVSNATGEEVFDRFYVCFERIKSSWRGACRPVIGLDGTFLKQIVKGCILAAGGHDANNQIYPIAWAVVQSENGPNWLWFVKQLKSDLVLEDGSRFVILSDRSKGLISAVKSELPNAEHQMCVKHIVENLKKNHAKKDALKPLVWQLAWSYNETEYKENIKQLQAYDLSLYNDVKKEKPETWSLAYFRIGSCCESVDNNGTESFNSTITKARALSLVPMLEALRRQIMARIVRRKKKSGQHEGKFSEYVGDILAEEKADADRVTVTPCTHGLYDVVLDGNGYTVNIPKGTCTCCKWQISGIPCEHAYGAMIDVGIDVEDHVSLFFSTQMWRDTYESANIPLRGARFWMNSTYRLVTAPPQPKLPGRGKGKKTTFPRIKGPYESPKKKVATMEETLGRGGRIMHCKSCKEAGHNAAGCKKFPKEKVKRKRKTEKGGPKKKGASSSGKEPETISLTQPSQETQGSMEA